MSVSVSVPEPEPDEPGDSGVGAEGGGAAGCEPLRLPEPPLPPPLLLPLALPEESAGGVVGRVAVAEPEPSVSEPACGPEPSDGGVVRDGGRGRRGGAVGPGLRRGAGRLPVRVVVRGRLCGPVLGTPCVRRAHGGRRATVLVRGPVRAPHTGHLGRRGGLGVVAGTPVHRGEGESTADEGHRGGDQGTALGFLPAGHLPPPRRPPRGRGQREPGPGPGHRVRAVRARSAFLRPRLRLRLRPRPRPRADCRTGRRVEACREGGRGRRARDGVTADDARRDVGGVGAASGAHEGAVQMPTARGAVVHPLSSRLAGRHPPGRGRPVRVAR